ncbi:CAP domain-containing protein [Mangrovihabitans endophyticus]|uniref:SCP domain-containing protein n=1 Tax=Mangrovihabitans endophyticus TaxID=1751298 RepID=A0A8J3C047_9ACTN|nr:CAP domain-containing protein [Mangrovihabitans endophyticus]GGK89646.1 hypothetical protein GCM10012284_24490 [Mangrovihabitans endophyticus]
MRTSILRRLLMLALVPAAVAGLLVVAAPAQAARVSFFTLQNDINYWVNHQRVNHGCPRLRIDNRLIRAARDHSAYMARYGRFSHTGRGGSSFVTRVRRVGYSVPMSENIAWGYRTGAQVVNAWMRSPGHRRNILNCRARSVGTGAVYAANGTPYYTQDFGYR